jgi:hypothetical protein
MINSKKYVLGADPGKHGGIVLLSTTFNPISISSDDIIQYPVKVTDEGYLDIIGIWNFLEPYRDQIVLCVQEQVHALFGATANSTFEFGDVNGMLYATLKLMLNSSCNKDTAKLITVSPKIWQKASWKPEHIVFEPQKPNTTRKKKNTKATSTNAAASIFPGVSFIPKRCRAVHDGLVDAALIAYYGLKKVYRLA